jgi:hypothetical protein
MNKQDKVAMVMREFKRGDLKSSSGKKVTNPKQAVAIGLSEAGLSRKKEGGQVKNTSRMNKLEEMGRIDSEKAYTSKGKKNLSAEKKRVVGELNKMKMGGKVKKYAEGGMPMVEKDGKKVPAFAADGKGKMARGGSVMSSKMGKVAVGKPKMGSASSRADGVAKKGKTVGKMLRKGGMCK